MNPQTVAIGSAAAGVALALGGIYTLAGPGWTLIAAAGACFGLAAVLFRGLVTFQGPTNAE